MLAALGTAALMWMLPEPAREAPPQIEAQPALYAVRDQDTTIYLFGTFHVLSPNIQWFNGAVEQAFDQADELVVETVPPERPTRPAPPLPSAMAPLTPSASFLSSAQDAVRAGQSRGMALANGADMVLLDAAAETGKAIEPLETLQSQFAMIAHIPSDGEPATPAKPAAPAADLGATMALLEGAWASGDHGLFTAMMNDMRASSPSAYRIMFAERNARWSNWVAARMREPGTVFVAVGAGHLAGSDSLLVRLAQRGLISRRIR